MSSPREVELKLDVTQAEAQHLGSRGLARLGGVEGERRHLVSVYFDTRKHALRRAGFSLRVRSDGQRRVQTLKEADGAAAGLFDRAEWESEIDGDVPAAAALDATPARRILAGKKGPKPLVPVFVTRVERRTWRILQGGSEIEVALDEGSVEAGGAFRSFCELELELKSGASSDLFALARRLTRTRTYRVAVLSKSDRGYALAQAGSTDSFKAGPTRVLHGMSAADAFRTIAQSCIRHFRLNETPLVESRSVEALHQARVAMRRLRSAVSLFAPLLDGPAFRLRKSRLRAVSSQLGEARNLDVYLAGLKARGQDGSSEPAAAVIARIEAEREAAYNRILTTLTSPSFQRFMVDLVAWIELGPARMGAGQQAQRDRPIADFAAEVLERQRRRVKKKGRDLEGAHPEARHAVRIDAKKLRYASDFFAGLVEGRKNRRRHRAMGAALEDLQGSLGDLNDIETAREIAAGLAMQGEPFAEGVPSPDGLVADRLAEKPVDAAALLAAAVSAHRDLVEVKRFWTRPSR